MFCETLQVVLAHGLTSPRSIVDWVHAAKKGESMFIELMPLIGCSPAQRWDRETPLDATYGVGAGEAMGVAIGDSNHDGKPDLVVANADSGIDVLLNQGGGKFGDATLYPNCRYSCIPGPFAVVIVDFNLDGAGVDYS